MRNTPIPWGIISQRCAYDFVMLDNEGKSYEESVPHDVESYYCYGAEILALSDGVVVQTGNQSQALADYYKKVRIPGRSQIHLRDEQVVSANILLKNLTSEELAMRSIDSPWKNWLRSLKEVRATGKQYLLTQNF